MFKRKILSVFITLLTFSVFGISAHAKQEQIIQAESPIIETISGHTLYAPTCKIVRFYYGVQYQWTAGLGADDMSVTDNNLTYRLIGGTYFQENSVVCGYSPSICPAWHNDCAASYYSDTNEYSEYSYNTDFNNYKHGQSIYSTKKYFDYPTASIPNKIDQKGFIWEHDGTSSYVIYATAAYNNEMTNIELSIPFIGLKSTTFSLGGQDFILRTGPKKVSVRAVSSSNIDINDFAFAFGIHHS